MAQKNAQPITSMEHIPASEHGKGFPPFATETFVSQLVWLVLIFAALYALMSKIALPRVESIFAARRQQREGDLAEAQRLKNESDAAIADYEKALADARSRAQTLANETREKYAAEAEARRKQLDATLANRIAEAEKLIAASRTAALSNVQTIAVDAAAAIVERLIGSAPPATEVAGAVADRLKQ
ncbi:MAG: F0F1 ATP synthase subunit B' [Xanthobacteraceae bacterium]